MNPRRRQSKSKRPTFIEMPEIDQDDDTDAVRQASMMLNVPEWVDPETGELADDELTRLEEH